jgi:nucleoside-diphosphate-sugar epimerase
LTIAAITGGTGFLGRYCVAALHHAGWQVRLLVRGAPTYPLLPGIPVDIVPGDLRDEAALARLVQGATAVVHVAGVVKALAAADFQTVNVQGTATLARIVARDAPAARFVLISSQAARRPELSPYAASKRAAERATSALDPARCAILRPGVIYGPWDHEGIAVLRLAQQRIAPVPRAPEPRLAMIHASDAAAAVVALCASGPPGALYELCDGVLAGHPWREIVRLAGTRLPWFLPVPDRVVRAAGKASEIWATLRGRPSVFSRGKAAEILHRDWRPDPAMQPPPALWTPQIGLEQGLRETVAWWREQPVTPPA